MNTTATITSTLALVLVLSGAPVGAAQSGQGQPAPAPAEGFARHMEELAARIGKAIEHIGGMDMGSARIREGNLTEKFSKTVPLARTGSFELRNISGDIVITSGAAEQVQIEAVKRGRTQEALANARIDVNQTANRVEVVVQYPRESKEGASVDFTVTVPKGASVMVHSVSGDLKLTGVEGELRAETVSGEVTVTGAPHLSVAKSVSGNVTVQSASNPDNLSASSVSGDVSLKGIKARSIEAQSISGEMGLIDVVCERANVRSTSGGVTFSGPLAKGGRYEVVSHSGDVTINTGDRTGFELTASTFSGDIKSDVPLTLRTGGDESPRPLRRQQLRGTFGDGSAVLILRSFSGDIRIVKK
jgi:DUF4097 and DUF4098 domain-containing protein YvlB